MRLSIHASVRCVVHNAPSAAGRGVFCRIVDFFRPTDAAAGTILTKGMVIPMKKNQAVRLTESAIMLAFSFILSFIAIVKMPFGGEVTAFSMLPVILIAYRYGWKWGCFTAFAFALLQMLMGMGNVLICKTFGAMAIVVLFDYVIAFTVLGLAGVFRRFTTSQSGALVPGILLVCLLRFLCHFISGITVWRDISIPANEAYVFSALYNAAYMIPETIVTIIGALFIVRVLDFRGETLTRAPQMAHRSTLSMAVSTLVLAVVCGAVLFDALHIFSVINGNENVAFDITRLPQANWLLLGIVTGAAALVAVIYCVAVTVLKKRQALAKA